MQLILKEKLEKILEKMKSDYKIKRLIAETYNDERYENSILNLLNELKEEKLINRNNLECSYELDEFNPVIVNNVFHSNVFDLLKNYYNEILSYNILPLSINRDIESKRYVAHNEFISRIIHFEMLELVEKITNKKLRPTYTYISFYTKGGRLRPHIDKPECDYTCSLILGKPKDSVWYLYLEKKLTNIVGFAEYTPLKDECCALDCNENGFMILKGKKNVHYRDNLEYDYYNILLLHYNEIVNTFSYN